MRERERENPQRISVLNISFKDFQGVLERLTHGSYVHLNPSKDHAIKKRNFSMEEEEEERNEAWAIFLGVVCVRVREWRKGEEREWERASCCFYAVLESQDGELVRTRVRTNILASPLLIINHQHIP